MDCAPFRRIATSKHVAWAAWCAVAVVTTTRSRWRHLAWLYPAATALVVLTSANHLLLDAVGGLAAAGLGMLATSRPSQLLTRRPTGGSTVARKHKRWETQRQVFPLCREGADHD